ncbi:hypothetical protein [Spirulina sp. 06S082]|uniref:hypothetical protein n=1 Tax=Spirulina sp. 06S082 TaxID=3110248 RepID=UPI002B220B7B|nr:hypothetical protein [Spirulina sp. 06S082]MEA5470004.1 hypothetical protein [Spirulina sp. 06S082]
MLKLFSKTIQRIYAIFPQGFSIGDRALPVICILGLFAFPSPFLLTKTYEGFQVDVDECNFDGVSGWFYWYIDTFGLCNIVMVANEEEALRQSSEILEYSFSVVRSGYGVNLGN